jgi:signal transduction histidine kinase
MIFLAVFMNLFFYRIVHEKLYLYFAIAAFFLAINRMSNIGYSYFFYKNTEMIGYVQNLTLAWLFIIYYFVQFYRSFLHLKDRFPLLDKIFIGSAWLFIVLTICRWLVDKFAISSFAWIGLFSVTLVFFIIPFLQLLVQLVSLKNSPKANYYLLAGSFPLLSLQIGSIFFAPEGLPYFNGSAFSKWMAENFRFMEAICLAILLLSITWVLFLRFIDLRKQNAQQALDKERLAREKEIERNELIATQKIQLEQEVAERTAELQQSLKELKTTQAQLVQSEKMAALGELTAGIAHEIQNPLNFVNNFSEVSVELVDEMKAELDKGETVEAAAIAVDIQQNLRKIAHHGKRAESIVKGMLQHSRTSTGMKEPTDINALCDEYLRLSYHGLRAKDKQFNAGFTSDFDATIGTIAVIPQDISRVLLNLYNNAFFAVREKQQSASAAYSPTVKVTTKKEDTGVIISVSDNGNGIPASITHKIFQPFFTTKPTGEGTGLGLSLSYDIIKAHNGAITVESKEGEGTTFMVELPFS